jgi:indolepyruvate ferredoxin oxidoreductase alpha subunit
MFLSGNEAVALAARDCGVALGTGYPGTPSTEILERFAALGGRAQWSPNEKVALEVAIGVSYAGAGALVTMKHVGLNVAADPLFTVAYTGVSGPLVIVSADDPGMASSQNEQDNRRYAVAACVPMLEPADSQEAYDFTRLAIKLSRQWKLPFLLRMTTRVCHSSGVIHSSAPSTPQAPHFEHDIPGRVMIPAYAAPGASASARETRRSSMVERNPRPFPDRRRLAHPGNRRFRSRVPPRPRGRAGCRYFQARHDLSASHRIHPPIRARGRTLHRN